MKNDNTLFNGIVIFVMFTLFLLICLFQIDKPIINEQTYYPYAANSIINLGKPIFGFDGFSMKLTQGIAHPPFYIYSLVFFIKIFGYNDFALKFSGIFFTIFNSILIFLIATLIFKNNKIIPLLSSFIYLFHPLTVQNSLLLSADGGIMLFFTLLFLYFFLKYQMKNKSLLILILTILLWIKFTAFISIIGAIFIYYLFLEKNKIKNLSNLTFITFLSFFIFLITFLFYTNYYHLDFLKPFTQNITDKFGGRVTNILFNLLRGVYTNKNFLIWVTPPLFIYLFYKLIFYFKEIYQKKSNFFKKFFLCFNIWTLFFFTLIGLNYAGFAKHYIILIPFLALMFSEDLYYQFKSFKFNLKFISLVFFTFVYLFIFIKDPVYTIDVWKSIPQLSLSVILPFLIKIVLILIPLIFYYLYSKFDFKKSIIFYSLIFMLYSTFYMIPVSYSTNVNYGDTGFEDTLSYLQEDINKSTMATIIAPHQFCYYLNKGEDFSVSYNNIYFYSVTNYYILDKNLFEKISLSEGNTYLIIYEHDLYRSEEVKKITEENFYFVDKIGTYMIYKLKQGKTKLEIFNYDLKYF